MNSFDAPIEALDIGYLSYGLLTAVNSVWAWVAVITAAVGFWRIRGLSSPPRRGKLTSSPPPPEKAAAEPAPDETKRSSSAATTSYCALGSEGSPKGKFSLYYCDDDFRGSDGGGEDDVDDRGCNAAVELGRRCDIDWEKTMVARMGDMGWYRCQDLNVFDGECGAAVVRPAAGSRRRRRRRGGRWGDVVSYAGQCRRMVW